MENNKIVAAILVGGLVAMLSGTFGKIVYNADRGDDSKRGYTIEVVSSANAKEAKKEINIFEMIASADATAGKKLVKKCVACHSFEKGGANKVGPNLYNIVGAKVAGKAGFQYSKAMIDAGGNWDYDRLWAFLNKPSKYMKGTKMAFAGLKKPAKLADLIAYLRGNADSPVALPAAGAAAE